MSKILILVGVASLTACGMSNSINSNLRDALDAQYPACSDAEQVRVFDHGTIEGADLTVCGVNRRFVSFDGAVTWTEDLRFAARMAVPEVAAVEAATPEFVATEDDPAPSEPAPSEPAPSEPALQQDAL